MSQVAKTLFYVTGSVFFIVATVCALWLTVLQGRRVVSLAFPPDGGMFAMTADGSTYVGVNGQWRAFGSIQSGRLGLKK